MGRDKVTLRPCFKCGKPESKLLRSHPELPRCSLHRKFTIERPCTECGTVAYVTEDNLKAGQTVCAECTNARKTQNAQANLREKFVRFLAKGRTKAEMVRRFKADAEWLLAEQHPGYRYFEQINNYNERVWALVPDIPDKITLKPKAWDYHIGVDSQGVPDPYILINLPDIYSPDSDSIMVVPLFDVHKGHRCHREEKFLKYIRWIAESDHIFAVLGGDIMENALDDGRGMMYDQEEPPESQMHSTTRILAPIAHKILCATRGNHEARTHRRAGIDPMRIICDRLEIPYFPGPFLMSVLAGERKWRFYVFHGKGNSQTKGGKMNAAQRAAKWVDGLDFLLSARGPAM